MSASEQREPSERNDRATGERIAMSASEQREKIETQDGFIAALDQSGGSTPKALRLHGVEEGAYSGDAEMYDATHAMRPRSDRENPGGDADRLPEVTGFARVIEALGSLSDRKVLIVAACFLAYLVYKYLTHPGVLN